MKCEIIKYLNFNDLKYVRRVSTIFKEIADEIFIPQACITSNFSENLHRLKLIDTMGIEHLKFEGLNFNKISIDNLICYIQSFEYNEVSTINFNKCHISDTYLSQFLDVFPKLKELNISESAQHLNYEKLLYKTACSLESFKVREFYDDKQSGEDNVDDYHIIDKSVTLRSLNLEFNGFFSFVRKPSVEKFFEYIRGNLISLNMNIGYFYLDELNWFVKMNFNYLKHLNITIMTMDYKFVMELINLITGQRMINYQEVCTFQLADLADELIFKHLQRLELQFNVHVYTDFIFDTIDFSRLLHLEVSTYFVENILKIFSEFNIFLFRNSP